jgi:predicted MFS family arabinose efflux permease
MKRRIGIPAPVRRPTFCLLWGGMGASYAGDQLQRLGQGWLVATLTGSATSVGLIAVFATVPLLFYPLGGVIVEQVDRRRLLIIGQLLGAAITVIIAALVIAGQIAVWQIYIWAFVSGLIFLVSRPAYKVVLTEVVPAPEVRSAVAINSTTETTALVAVNAAGSILLSVVGLAFAFIMNAISYVVAVAALLAILSAPSTNSHRIDLASVGRDLAEGISYLFTSPKLVRPLSLTGVTVLMTAPVLSVLPVLVQERGGTLVDVGILFAALSGGSFVGAIVAGARDERADVVRRYTGFALLAAAVLAGFSLSPVGPVALVAVFVIGFVLFSEGVWNTTRVRQVAPPTHQSRLQAMTSMAFSLGVSGAALWAGVAVDRFGPLALAAVAVGAVIGWRPAVTAATQPVIAETRWR